MIILDTDHINVLQDQQAVQHATLMANISSSSDQDFRTTIVSLEEQLRGWLAVLNRATDVTKHVMPYDRLSGVVQFYSQWNVLPFDDRCADQFKQLRQQKIRIGTMDLKIGFVAIVNQALLSANLRDFRRIPNLTVENWLH